MIMTLKSANFCSGQSYPGGEKGELTDVKLLDDLGQESGGIMNIPASVPTADREQGVKNMEIFIPDMYKHVV